MQVIKDSFNNVKLTTEFLKVPGGNHGGSWVARIKGEPIHLGEWVYELLFYYELSPVKIGYPVSPLCFIWGLTA